MSEEEIIRKCNWFIKNDVMYEQSLYDAIQGLLDLYQKEKELSLKRFKNLVKIQEEKDKNYNKGYFQGRKDERDETDKKIKELIEQLEDVLDLAEGEKNFPKYRKQALIEEIKDLQELLEERN